MRTTDLSNLDVTTSKTTCFQLEYYLRNDYWRLTHRHLSEKSIRLTIQHIRVFSLWWEAYFHESFEASRITNYDLRVYRTWSLDQERVRAATWNSRLWAFGIYASMLGREDLLEGIEAKGFVRGSTRHRSLTEEEFHRLVHLIEQNKLRAISKFEYRRAVRDAAIVGLMLFAGLRVEEVSLLNNEDACMSERSGAVLVRNGKGNKERTVPLSLMAHKWLSAWRELRGDQKTGSLFHGKDDQQLTTRTIQRIVRSCGIQIRVPDLTPHWLRYTFAKRLEKAGVSIESIRDLLGHNSIETTRRYLRSSHEELQAAVEFAL